MPSNTWSVRIDNETKELLESTLKSQIDLGTAENKAEALRQLINSAKFNETGISDPALSSYASAINRSFEVIRSQFLALSRMLNNIETEASAKAQNTIDIQIKALEQSQKNEEALKEEIASLKAENKKLKDKYTKTKIENDDLTERLKRTSEQLDREREEKLNAIHERDALFNGRMAEAIARLESIVVSQNKAHG